MNSKDFVIEESELVHITDQSHIKVGNGSEGIKIFLISLIQMYKFIKGIHPLLWLKSYGNLQRQG